MDTDIHSEVTSIAGETATLHCLESVGKDVTWQYQRSLAYLPEYVYYIGDVYPHFQPRFTVNRSVSQQYDLVIAKAEVTDSGEYLCIEDGGQGVRHVYQLRIIGWCLLLPIFMD